LDEAIIEKAGMNKLLPSSEPEGLNQTRSSLIGRLRDWDNSLIWSEFFETYWRFIYRCAIKGGLTDGEAQEVVQQTMITVARKMREGDYGHEPKTATFKTWLCRIVRLHILQERRRQWQQSQRIVSIELNSPGDDANTQFDQIADPANLHQESWEQEWRQNLVNAAAERVKKRVKPMHYQIFAYHQIQGHSVKETAHDLHTNVAQVYLVTHRVQKLLRTEIERLRENPPGVFAERPRDNADNQAASSAKAPMKFQV